MNGAFIKGVGAYVPSTILSNTELTEMHNCTDNWIVSRTGIHERLFCYNTIALDNAIKDGRIKRGDILAMVSFGAGLVWGSALIEY